MIELPRPNYPIAYAGIDLAFARNKKLPLCVCTKKAGKLIPITLNNGNFPTPPVGRGNAETINKQVVKQFVDEVAFYLEEVQRIAQVSIATVAIDGPRTPGTKGRKASELALDEMNIRCFPTPTRSEFERIRGKVRQHLDAGLPLNRLPHGFQLWMLVGFALFEGLSLVYECLEVFPQATAKVLATGKVHKSRAEGLQQQIKALAKRTGWQAAALEKQLKVAVTGAPHDRVDAFSCAWIASLYPDQTKACGIPPDDVIWLPEI